MRINQLYVTYALLMILGLSGCFFSEGGGGGGSETETVAFVMGKTVDGSGHAVAGALIRIRSVDYLADFNELGKRSATASDKFSDSQGHFKIDNLGVGNYRVEARIADGNTAVAELSIPYQGKEITLKLEAPGTLTGEAGIEYSPFPRVAKIYGLEAFSNVDVKGHFSFNALPSGNHLVVLVSEDPFRPSSDIEHVVVRVGETDTVFGLKLNLVEKLATTTTAQGVVFAGVTPTSPLIYDNEQCSNVQDDEYLMAKAATGNVNWRGFIVTHNFLTQPNPTLAASLQDCKENVAWARRAGMQGMPDPIAGADARLPERDSLGYFTSGSSAGAELIVREAWLASPEKPLYIAVGGTLSTVAQAYLLDPRIADRLIVVGNYNQSVNSGDTLANYLVARNLRFIHFKRENLNGVARDSLKLSSLIPGDAMGLRLRSMLSHHFADLGDLPVLMPFFRPTLISAVRQQIVTSPPLVGIASSGAPGDYLEAPDAAVSGTGIDGEFIDALNAKGIRKPWLLPAQLEGVAFSNSDHVDLMHEGLEDKASVHIGGFIEYQLSTPKAISLSVSVLGTGQSLKLFLGDQEIETLSFQADGYAKAATPLQFSAGINVLRIVAQGSSAVVQEIRVQP